MITAADAESIHHVAAVITLPGGGKEIVQGPAEFLVFPEIGIVPSRDHDVVAGLRRPDHIEGRTERIARTGFDVEELPGLGAFGFDTNQVRLELVAALIGIVEHRVLVVEVETEQRVRDGHRQVRLPDLRHGRLVGIRDDDGFMLRPGGERKGGEGQYGDENLLFHGAY